MNQRFIEKSVGNDKWIVVVGINFMTHQQAVELRESLDYICNNNYLIDPIIQLKNAIEKSQKPDNIPPRREART